MLQKLSRNIPVRFLLLALALKLAFPCVGEARQSDGVSNVRFEVLADRVYIYYDLAGDPGDKFNVTISLRREGSLQFVHLPGNLTGDVGLGVAAGKQRRIIWNFRAEFPQGIQGEDFYFLIEAEPEESEGVSPIIVILGGVAIVGGVLALLLSGGGDDNPPPSTTGFPAPPGRP